MAPGLITGVASLDDYAAALEIGPDVIKTVIRLSDDVTDELTMSASMSR